MFEIQFRNRFVDQKSSALKKMLPTLKEASDARFASGDLVINSETNKIVTDDAWLWDWEKADPNSYAMKAIAWQKRMNEKETKDDTSIQTPAGL